jgi:cysteine-rich repeat protein
LKKSHILVGIAGVLALFAACGTDRIGGDSETNWMERCDTASDCDAGTECLCGVCSKSCAGSGDCSGLAGPAECLSSTEFPGCDASTDPERVCLPAASSDPSSGGSGGIGGRPEGVTGGVPSSGAGGDAGSDGGLGCLKIPKGDGGASSISAVVPPLGTPCAAELEGFELCTPKGDLWNAETALSRCANGIWTTVEDPSDCERPHAPACEEPGACMWETLQCNIVEAADGVCCGDLPKYCENISAVCDGTRWWKTAWASGTCGDGVRQQTEECDDGNDSDRDDCLPSCRLPECGDGFVHDQGTGDEACDDGDANGPYPAECTDECKLGLCGNGEVDDGEECDDGVAELVSDGNYVRGNHENAACTPSCAFNSCGDGGAYVIQVEGQENPYGLEECDDGGNGVSDPCTDECDWNRCGDGVWYAVSYEEAYFDRTGDGNPIADNPSEGEECDDGNDVDGDGCDAQCSEENP